MEKYYYYSVHVGLDCGYDYTITLRNNERLSDEEEIVKLAIIGNFFEDDEDFLLVDDVKEITETEYNRLRDNFDNY